MRANHKFITATRPLSLLVLKITYVPNTNYITAIAFTIQIQKSYEQSTLRATNKQIYCRDFPKKKKKNCHFPKHSRRDTLNKGHLNDWIVGYLNLLICTQLVLNSMRLCAVFSCNKPQVSPLTICNFWVHRMGFQDEMWIQNVLPVCFHSKQWYYWHLNRFRTSFDELSRCVADQKENHKDSLVRRAGGWRSSPFNTYY